jgi:hypothetical protein
MKRQFLVTFDMPPGATVADAVAYVDNAVAVYRGSMDPEEPMSDLDNSTVKVRALPRKRKGKSTKQQTIG